MADQTQTSAIFKRHEQLKRWHESDTNKCLDNTTDKSKRVKFQDGCVFLAACSSGDTEEVERLLDRGADINTANIDGLTALHQACIDDNLDMVEFLVAKSADVNVCDNEGWTPLHATASCGFTEIARYLLGTPSANVAAVNNDGDLPYDICEDATMEKLLQESMEAQGVDADAARREEEDCMMEDANQWLNGNMVIDEKHPKTGATALHVAAAKGYAKVITVLLEAGVDINAKDHDGWTSLHAAAHWGQEESCKILAENMCDMETKNLAGQTAFDVADTELVKLLEELKLKQASLKDQQKDQQKEIIQTKVPSSRRSRNDPARRSLPDIPDGMFRPPSLPRRSSVTRMSVEQKHNVMKASDEERLIDAKMAPTKEEEPVKTSSSSCSEDENETEKKNEINKQSSGQNQPRDRDKPPIMTTVEIKEKQTDMPKIEETLETDEKENLKKLVDNGNSDIRNENDVLKDDLFKDKILNNDKNEIEKEEDKDKGKKELLIEDEHLKGKENKTDEKKEKEQKEQNEEKKQESYKDKDILIEKVKDNEKDVIENTPSRKEREGLKRTISAPPSIAEVPKITLNTKSLKDRHSTEIDIPSWRLGLRKTGSTSAVPEETKKNTINEDDKNLSRSASSPRLTEENENKKNEKNDKPIGRRPFLSSSSFSSADHNNSSTSDRYGGTQPGLSNPYRYTSGLNSTSAYVPLYKRLDRERAEKDKENNRIQPVTSGSMTTGSTISTTSSVTTITTPTSSFSYSNRKSYEPPKRDEETEMLRKVRAKRARETRRSTQGVTLEEVQQANETLRKPETSATGTVPTTMSSSLTTTATTTTDRSRLNNDRKSQDVSDSQTDTLASSASDKTGTSRLSSDISVKRTSSNNESDSSVASWRRQRESRDDPSKKDDISRSSSFRRSRVGVDLSNSTPTSSFYADSTYVPRSQRGDRGERNALSMADTSNTSLSTGSGLTRSTSLRQDRLHNTYDDSRIELRRDREKDADKKDISETSDKTEKPGEKRPESTAIKNRRMRRERRSTGIATYTAENNEEEEDKDKENKDESKDDNKESKDGDEKSSRFNRYGSASDVPSHLSSRPSSYTEYSRSTPSLEKDYKRLYEEEKIEKDRLKRDLEQCKRELKEAKLELDKQMKRHEASRVTDTNDKRERRALERKLSELEEEIKKMDQIKEDNRRLREENGALIRVISKLSK